MAPLLTGPSDVDGWPQGARQRHPRRGTIVLAEPTRFAVTRQDNPHTVDADGRLHDVDRKRAHQQWDQLEATYEQIGFDTTIVDAEPGLPDLVFCRNTAFPYLGPDGQHRFIPGRMRYEGRRGEVPLVADHLEAQGYEPTPLPEGLAPFECGGDLVRLNPRNLVFAGTGERTSHKALDAAADLIEAPLAVLELVDPDFYHLDTCLATLDEDTIAWVPGAFADRSRELIEALPVETIEVPEAEARATFAANLHCPDGDNVLVDEANTTTIELLADAGYTVHPLDTSEFRKAGGSVFCMTNQVW